MFKTWLRRGAIVVGVVFVAIQSAETVPQGEMPPAVCRWLHREAVLSPAERQRLIDGLSATFGGGRDLKHED